MLVATIRVPAPSPSSPSGKARSSRCGNTGRRTISSCRAIAFTRDGATAGSKTPISRIFPNEAFGYRTITVERPERDAAGQLVRATKGKAKGQPVPDAALRDTENVPLSEDIDTYFRREVLPHAPDAWIDHEKTKIGYEIPFNRHFYEYEAPRPLDQIEQDIEALEKEIIAMLKEVV